MTTYTHGQTATIQVGDGVNSSQSGLTPKTTYYVQEDGTLATTPDSISVLAGTAVSATKILIDRTIAGYEHATNTRPIAPHPVELPAPSTAGKLLTSDGTNWVSTTAPVELPAPSTSGNLLTSDGTNWNSTAAPVELPAAGAAGKILKSDGTDWISSDEADPIALSTFGFTAVASGSIGDGKGVIINSDGTVSVCEGAQGSRSEGTPVVFEEATTSDIAAVYDSVEDQVWVAYRDEGNLNKGTVVNGTVSGTTITWGNPFVFAAAATSMISIAYDANQEKAVISYRDDDNSNYGTSCVVNYDGTSTTGTNINGGEWALVSGSTTIDFASTSVTINDGAWTLNATTGGSTAANVVTHSGAMDVGIVAGMAVTGPGVGGQGWGGWNVVAGNDIILATWSGGVNLQIMTGMTMGGALSPGYAPNGTVVAEVITGIGVAPAQIRMSNPATSTGWVNPINFGNGNFIAPGTTVVSVDNASTLTLSANVNGPGSANPLTFVGQSQMDAGIVPGAVLSFPAGGWMPTGTTVASIVSGTQLITSAGAQQTGSVNPITFTIIEYLNAGSEVAFNAATTNYISSVYDDNAQKVAITYNETAAAQNISDTPWTLNATQGGPGNTIITHGGTMNASIGAGAVVTGPAVGGQGWGGWNLTAGNDVMLATWSGGVNLQIMAGMTMTFPGGGWVPGGTIVSEVITGIGVAPAQIRMSNPALGTGWVNPINFGNGNFIAPGTTVASVNSTSEITLNQKVNGPGTGVALNFAVIPQYGKSIIATVSGTTPSFGTAATYESGATLESAISYDANAQKVAIAYIAGTVGYGVVGTIAGTDISFGTKVDFSTAGAGIHGDGATSRANRLGIGYDANSQKHVIAWKDATPFSARCVVGTISGTDISYGTNLIFKTQSGNNSAEYIQCIYDSVGQRVLIVFRDTTNSNYGTVIPIEITGTTPSLDTAQVFESADTRSIGAASMCMHGADISSNLIAYADYGNSNYGTGAVTATEFVSTNLTLENLVGFSKAVYADGATAHVQTTGSIDDAQSGLTPAQKYYMQFTGDLATAVNATTTTLVGEVPVGTALSATKILIKI